MINLILAQLTYSGPTANPSTVLKNATTVVFTALGIVSVLVIVYAGIRLTLARGNPDAIGKLRSTLIYASIGLVIAISASLIISFVVGGV